jgi:hypothetical protein
MVNCIGTSAGVQRVGISKKRFTSETLYESDDNGGIVGAQIGQVARFTEMNLYGHKLIIEVNALNAGSFDQSFGLNQ